MVIEPLPVPLTAEGGELRVTGTRVPLQYLTYEYRQGASAEEIAARYPSLTLAQVHALIAYYLEHRAEVDAYVLEREAEATTLREKIEARFPAAGLRERLLARLERR